VDTTIIDAPSSTKRKAGARNPEMSSTTKGNDWYFGMMVHIGVDADSGVTHSLETSTPCRRPGSCENCRRKPVSPLPSLSGRYLGAAERYDQTDQTFPDIWINDGRLGRTLPVLATILKISRRALQTLLGIPEKPFDRD